MRSIEILQLREEIAILDGNIENSESYIEYLKQRYTSPLSTMGKYREKINKWKKEKWELQKQLLVLENEPCNE